MSILSIRSPKGKCVGGKKFRKRLLSISMKIVLQESVAMHGLRMPIICVQDSRMYRFCTNTDSFFYPPLSNLCSRKVSWKHVSIKHKTVCLCSASAKPIEFMEKFKELGELKDKIHRSGV